MASRIAARNLPTLLPSGLATLFFVLALVALVASNWQGWDRLTRLGFAALLFPLLWLPLLWRLRPGGAAPRDSATALLTLLAFATIGPLLALVGQTYQLGADAYGLFLVWALLGLPLIIPANGRWLWFCWLLVAAAALLLWLAQTDLVSAAQRNALGLGAAFLLVALPLGINEALIRRRQPNRPDWSARSFRRLLLLALFPLAWGAEWLLLLWPADGSMRLTLVVALLVLAASLLLSFWFERRARLSEQDRVSLALIGLFWMVAALSPLMRWVWPFAGAILGSTLILIAAIAGLVLLVRWYRAQVGVPVASTPAHSPNGRPDLGLTLLVVGAAMVIGWAALSLIGSILLLLLDDWLKQPLVLLGLGLALLAPIVWARLAMRCAESIAQIAQMALFSAGALAGIALITAAILTIGDPFETSLRLTLWCLYWVGVLLLALWVAPHASTKVIAVAGPLLVIYLSLLFALGGDNFARSDWRMPLPLILIELLLAVPVWGYFLRLWPQNAGSAPGRWLTTDPAMLVAGLMLALGGAWVLHSLLDVQLFACLTGFDLSASGRALPLDCPGETGQRPAAGTLIWALLPRLLLAAVALHWYRRQPLLLLALLLLAAAGSLELAVSCLLLLRSAALGWRPWAALMLLATIASAVRFYFNADWTFLGSSALLLLFALAFAAVAWRGRRPLEGASA